MKEKLVKKLAADGHTEELRAVSNLKGAFTKANLDNAIETAEKRNL